MTNSPPYWIGVDRDELRTECQTLATNGGLLSVVGGKASGRSQAAKIATHVFQNQGLRTLVVPDPGDRVGSLRYVLHTIIDFSIAATTPVARGLRSEASNASVENWKLLAYCKGELARLKEFAIVITALWQDSPPLAKELKYLLSMKDAGGVWAVISHGGKIWAQNDIRQVTLTEFDREQVSDTLQQLLVNCGGDTALINTYLEDIFCTRAAIEPLTAYAKLQILEDSLARAG
ncbi:hypothetical protein ACFV98_21175 [Streptomyces violascens]|uniref:hypothetical protein n=1 Tax=Streptomyces violascens TaxID=67381 RepID=UPI00365044AE